MTMAPIAVSTALSFIALCCSRSCRSLIWVSLGLPRLVIRRRRLGSGKIKAALRPIGGPGAGGIRQVRLLPFARLIVCGRGRLVDRLVHPAIPARRNGRCLGIAIVDHPAPAAPVLMIAIAEFIGADEAADQRGINARADGGAVPPGE